MKLAILALAMLSLSACGQSFTTPEATVTGPESSTAVAKSVSSVVTDAMNSGGALTSKPGLQKLGQKLGKTQSDIDSSVSCSEGGSISSEGTVGFNVGDESLTANIEISSQMNECSEKGENGEVYTIDGNLDLEAELSMTIEITDSSLSLIGSSFVLTSGTVDVSGGDINEENCEISLSQSESFVFVIPDSGSASFDSTATWSGTVCGEETSGSTTVSETL